MIEPGDPFRAPHFDVREVAPRNTRRATAVLSFAEVPVIVVRCRHKLDSRNDEAVQAGSRFAFNLVRQSST